MHLDDEQVERLRDGEAVPEAARRHFERCTECAAQVARAQAEVAELGAWLGALDPPSPSPADAPLTTVALRATLADATTPVARRIAPRRHGGIAAAAAALVVVAGIAFALPGSPLRAWLTGLVAGPRRDAMPERPVAPSPPPVTEEVARSGVAVVPGDQLVVRFARAQSAGVVTVRLADDAELLIEGPAGAATYGSAAGRLVVDNADPLATYVIRVPRTAPRVEIRVAGRRVFLKEGMRITAGAAEPGPDGAYVLPLIP